MILLLGGTSETAPLATALAEAGYGVLVSTATDVPLDVGSHPRVRRRAGPLDLPQMAALIRAEGVRAVADATHPYAIEVKATAAAACRAAGVPCFRLERPPSVGRDSPVRLAASHEEAARLAGSLGLPILLTTGTRNLEPYVREASHAGCPLFVRVLPHAESLEACRRAGVRPESVIAARGPFSVEENREAIRQHGIGVLVAKDSGEAGGTPAKIEAARQEGCQVVVVARPASPCRNSYPGIAELVDALVEAAPPST